MPAFRCRELRYTSIGTACLAIFFRESRFGFWILLWKFLRPVRLSFFWNFYMCLPLPADERSRPAISRVLCFLFFRGRKKDYLRPRLGRAHCQVLYYIRPSIRFRAWMPGWFVGKIGRSYWCWNPKSRAAMYIVVRPPVFSRCRCRVWCRPDRAVCRDSPILAGRGPEYRVAWWYVASSHRSPCW